MIQARKRFGQNFLHDRHIIHKIITAIAPATHAHIVEIGPGRGALTYPLLESAKQLTAIEIDRDLIAQLREKAPKLHLIEGDVLKVDFSLIPQSLCDSSLIQGSEKLTIVGNLPYNISTPLLFHLLEFREHIEAMFFMLQKEVVLRMAAEPNSKDYGRLSVMIQYFCEVDPLFLVPPGAFTPAPQVDSMIVRLKPYALSPYGAILDFKHFENIVRLAFNQRRKTLRNALKSLALSIPDEYAYKRAEELSVQDFVDLAQIKAT